MQTHFPKGKKIFIVYSVDINGENNVYIQECKKVLFVFRETAILWENKGAAKSTYNPKFKNM